MESGYDSKKLVYWAEDDQEDMDIFEQFVLEIAPDYDIVKFENGRLLINHLESLKASEYPNLIVLDMHMPVMDGIETLIALSKRKKYQLIPKVVFTTSNNHEDKDFCDSMNAKMLTKPFTVPALSSALQTIIGYARAAV